MAISSSGWINALAAFISELSTLSLVSPTTGGHAVVISSACSSLPFSVATVLNKLILFWRVSFVDVALSFFEFFWDLNLVIPAASSNTVLLSSGLELKRRSKN